MTIDPDDLEEMAESQPGDPNRHFLIYCDESGIDAGTVFGFGSLWMPWERRGDFLQLWRRLQQSHFPPSEAKWTKVKSQTGSGRISNGMVYCRRSLTRKV